MLLRILLGAVLLGGCAAEDSIGDGMGGIGAGPDAGEPAPESVTIRYDIGYANQNVEVRQGGTVWWNTAGSATHTITWAKDYGLPTRGFFSGSFSLTFDEPGVYEYYCETHPDSMAGNSITVY